MMEEILRGDQNLQMTLTGPPYAVVEMCRVVGSTAICNRMVEHFRKRIDNLRPTDGRTGRDDEFIAIPCWRVRVGRS